MSRPKFINSLLAGAIIFSLTLATQAENTKVAYNHPGGIAELRIEKLSDELPEIRYGIREPIVIEHSSYWRVLVGLSLDTLPGEYLVYLKHGTEDARSEHRTFDVDQRSYPLHDDSSLSINKTFIEHSSLSEIDFSNTQQPTLPLRFPASGQWADKFGHIVIDDRNNRSASQNLVSLTTTELLTVVAPQNAIISKIETAENGLSTIFLDHGRGLMSVIGGVTDLSVEPGNGVVAGAVIAKLPSRNSSVTGGSAIKRLTWQCIINGAYVNPIILTQL